MRSLCAKLIEADRHYKELLHTNCTAADVGNMRVMKITLIGAIIIFSGSFLLSFFLSSISYMRLAYLIIIAVIAGLLVLIQFSKHIPTTLFVYAVFTAMVAYSTLTSALLSPNYVCVTILAVLFQFPVLYVDRGWRINFAVGLAGLLYLCSICTLKDRALFPDELSNVAAFAVLSCIVGRFTRRDRLENIEMKRQLHLNAYTDSLTGLANRRSFFERLTECEKPDCVQPVTGLIMLDLDDFKSFNDTYGHQAGDECLKAFGGCLKEYESKYDILFYRYGGEEFVGASCIYTDKELADICDQLRESVGNLKFEKEAAGRRVTVSIGIATEPDDLGKTYTRLLTMADIALYAAKTSGKNSVVIFNSSLEQDVITLPAPSFRQR